MGSATGRLGTCLQRVFRGVNSAKDAKKEASRPTAKERKRESLMRGVTNLAAAYLLETMVMGYVYIRWGGAWKRRFYCTVTPDSLEIGSVERCLSLQAWSESRLTMQRWDISEGNFRDSYMNDASAFLHGFAFSVASHTLGATDTKMT